MVRPHDTRPGPPRQGLTRAAADFAIDKPAGAPCRNLADDFSCTVHDSLRGRGFRGCTVFDCFGAGQHVSQNLFDGRSWKDRPDTSAEMFATFAVVRQLHEMLWYLAEAAERAGDTELAEPALRLRAAILHILDGGVATILASDVENLRADVRQLLIAVSEEARGGYAATATPIVASPGAGACTGIGVRSGTDGRGGQHSPADLPGRDLRDVRLHGADLRGACLIAADLRGNDLSGVDLLGADLRDARLDSADLSAALFLTQPQIDAARGDHTTLLPAPLTLPSHWPPRSR